jgi:hypothetical protein
MNLEDKVALDWMARFTREPLPRKVVWHQSPVTHDRLYWLALPKGQARAGQTVVASRERHDITIEKAEGVDELIVLLSDAMVDLDKPVKVTLNGKALFQGAAPRTIKSLHATLSDRGDPHLIFDSSLTVRHAGS